MWLSILAIIISVIAIFISTLGWHKSRAIYDIEKYKFPKRVGDSKTVEDKRHENALKEKLKKGKWQILHICENLNSENMSSDLIIVVGKNKK